MFVPRVSLVPLRCWIYDLSIFVTHVLSLVVCMRGDGSFKKWDEYSILFEGERLLTLLIPPDRAFRLRAGFVKFNKYKCVLAVL